VAVAGESDLDRRAIVEGATVAAGATALAYVAGLLAAVAAGTSLTDADAPSWTGVVIALLFIVLLAGSFIGGGVAGRNAASHPMTHGALATASGFAAVALVVSVIQAASGEWRWAALISQLFLMSTVGLVGGRLGAITRGITPTEGEPGS